jgi:hypothetical protein
VIPVEAWAEKRAIMVALCGRSALPAADPDKVA